MIPIKGYYPDADQTSTGVIIEADGIIPTLKGSYVAAPTMQATTYPALANKALGVASIQLLDGTSRLIAGTDTKLYEGEVTNWVDRSRAGNYTTGAKKWRFGVFGNVVLAANGVDVLQASTAAETAFSNVTGSPKCKVFDVSQGFVMMGDTDEATYGHQSDRWWCSAIYDYTDWTVDVATQVTTGRLVDAAGAIRAMKALGGSFVAYKDNAMFLGSYVGTPLVWSWQLIPSEIGCSSQEAVANVPSLGHVFIGQENIYVYNGAGLPSPIGDGIKNWFFNDINLALKNDIRSVVDKIQGNVWFFYPRKDSSTDITGAIIYNWRSQKWGVWRGRVQCAVEYLTGSITYDTAIGDYDEQILAFDSPALTNTTPYPSVIDNTNTLKTLTGTAGIANITFAEFGDDARYTSLLRVKPRFLKVPTTATMTNQYRKNQGEPLVLDKTNAMSDGKFDFRRSARWHRVTLQTTGDCEISGLAFDIREDGFR